MKTIKDYRREFLKQAWPMYLKQKATEEASGHDTTHEIEWMRGWFRKALTGACTAKERLERFPEQHETDNPLACDKCGDTGWYFSEEAEIERMGPKGKMTLEVPGMVVCFCAAGSQKNKGIAELGKKEPRGRRGGKFF